MEGENTVKMDASKRISTMDALLFAMNLEVMLLQLRILEGSVERCNRQWIPRTKNGTQQREKLCRDRQIVKDIVRGTLIEVAENGVWDTLQHAVGILEHSSSSMVTLRANHDDLKNSVEAICSDLLDRKHQYDSEIRECDRKIAHLRDKIKDNVLNTNTQLLYADKWLCARGEAMELRFQFDASPSLVPNADHEYHVHTELMRAYELQIKERADLLEYWKSRYTNDTANLAQRLSEQCEMLRVTTARRTELQQLYNLHQGEMRGWLNFKRERAARLAREERIRVAASRIQAWWRGLMVRRALGSFRYLRNTKKAQNKSKKK